MEVNEIISKFQEFVEINYQKDLFKNIKEGKRFLVIEFNELAKFNIELCDELLEKPEETLKAFELSLNNFDIEDVKDVKIRVKNLPQEHYILIKNIRSKDIGKFIWTEGVVRQKSDVRPQVTSARFECPSCGNIIPVLQLDKKFKEPSRCGCGRKGKFRLLSKELVDAQGLVLEEATKDLEGGAQPKRMNVFLQNDLVSPMSERKTNPGNQVRISGVIKEVPIILRTGGQSTKFDLMIETNYIEAVEEDYSNILISDEDEEQIKIIAEDPKVISKLSSALAPGIFGHDLIKEAMCLQFVGGVSKLRDDGVRNRGDIHMLLIGDPGCGKCVSGDTKIILEDGEITTIKEFHEDKNCKKVFTINSYGNNDTKQPSTFWKRPSPTKLLKITTNTGNELILTKEHPLFTTKNGFVFAKEAQDFSIGEYISTPSRIDIVTEQQLIDYDVEKSKSRNKIKYQQKQLLNEQWARLLGYLIGDGYVRFKKTTGIISFTNIDTTLLNDFECLVKDIFNIDVKKRQKLNTNCYEYYFSSIEITRILEKINKNILKRSGEQQIPKIICKSPDNILKEFLKAFFDCEAHVNKDKRRIEISSKSKHIIEDLKYLLLRFNILSQTRSMIKYASNTVNKTKRTYYQLSISGEDVVKFYNLIGSNSKKDKILQRLSQKDIKFNTNINIVPNMNELLYVLRTKHGLNQNSFSIPRSSYQHYERGDRYPSHTQLKKIYNAYEIHGINDLLINILKQAANADIFWDKIKSIKIIESKEEYVYDFEIPDIHNFVANGVMVHNSQLLKRASVVAPKARYVSGKGVSGAGLTAAVVKDEFLSGWSLEAGALVLANKGMVMIDEMDKMSTEDRSAMHEALEQQSYHYDFEIMMGDGSKEKIGKLIDRNIEQNKDKTIQGKDCEILATDNINIITTDFKKTFISKANRISRHLAPKYFYKIYYNNGRSIIVTPEHPLFVYSNGEIKETPACLAEEGMIVPAVRKINTKENIIELKPIKNNHFNNKKIEFPNKLNKNLAKLLGYIVTEGHSYYNKKNRYGEIGISNTDKQIIEEVDQLFKKCFKTTTNINLQKKESRKKAKKDIFTVRCCSIQLYKYFQENFGELVSKAPQKRIPASIMCSNKILKHNFLHTAFKGDGFVDSERCGFSTASKKLAEDYQDMLLQLGVWNYIAVEKRDDKKYYKVVISGEDSLVLFLKEIVKDDKRKERVSNFLNRSKNRRNSRDIVPYEMIIEVNSILKILKISDGYFVTLIQRKQNSHKKVVREYMQKALKKVKSLKNKQATKSIVCNIEKIMRFIDSDIKLIRIKAVKKVKNKDSKWVYDVTVEPTKTFVSSGLVLHNTVSISKANIQATLRCETTVLAAANPKFGRFDPYDTVAKQIDLPPALINRFDLIFTLKDIPDEEKDKKMARFILEMHKIRGTEETDVSTDLLRKYFIYAKQKISPRLSEKAIEEILEYYIKMRGSGASEDRAMRAIPISARQLEALVRLSEASAKLRLGKEVTSKDAKRAIALIHYCLEQVGMDPETGKIDIDRISTGITTSERGRIVTIREIINELEAQIGKNIPIEEVINSAKDKGIEEDKVLELIEKLKRSGDLFEPRRGEVQKI